MLACARHAGVAGRPRVGNGPDPPDAPIETASSPIR